MTYAYMKGNIFFAGVELIINRVTMHTNWFGSIPDRKGRSVNIVGADPGDAEAVARAAVDAQLAVAFELRTANLIAVASAISPEGVYALDPALVDAASTLLAERLGMEG